MRSAYEQCGWKPVTLITSNVMPLARQLVMQLNLKVCVSFGLEEDTDKHAALGAVKANVGHLLTGAGAVGLIKTIMAMDEGQIPPLAHFTAPGAKIPLGRQPFCYP